jgi:hypothetical protein
MQTPAGRRTSCAWITAPNAIGRPILRCFKLDFFGEALQISEKNLLEMAVYRLKTPLRNRRRRPQISAWKTS